VRRTKRQLLRQMMEFSHIRLNSMSSYCDEFWNKCYVCFGPFTSY
jgi:hypothetical protein